MGRTTLAAAAILLLLLVSAPASAQKLQHHSFAQRIQYALVLARAYWKGAEPPCPGGINGITWSWTAGDVEHFAFAESPGCRIYFSAAGVNTLPNRAIRWELLCDLMAHEYGHLLGHGHSATPDSVMYPNLFVAAEPEACLPSESGA
jgi:hypothetical protein